MESGRRTRILLVGVIAIQLALLGWIAIGTGPPRVAQGGTVDSAGGYTLATGRLQSRGDTDALYIWNHEQQKLAVYLITGRNLEVLAVRDCSFDFAVPGFSPEGGQQRPRPSDMKRAAEKGTRD